MPTYVVTGPDGKKYRVTAPEGASEQEVMARVRQQSSAPPKQTKTGSALLGLGDIVSMGFLDELGAVADTIGLPSGEKRPTIWNSDKSVGEIWRENQRRNSQINRKASKDNPKSYLAGQVAGGLLPVGVAGRTAKTAQALKNAPRLARVAAAAAPVAAESFAYGFGSTDGGIADRAKGGAEMIPAGLAGAAAGTLLGKGISRLAKGKAVPKNVRLLADEDIVLTPGQRAGRNSIRNTFEDKVLGSVPILNQIPEAAFDRGSNDLRRAVANRVLEPLGDSVPRGTRINNEFIGGLQDRVYGALEDAAGALRLQGDDALTKGLDDIAAASPRLVGNEGAQQVSSNINYIRDRIGQEGISGNAVRETLGELRKAASGSQGTLREQLWGVHDELVGALERQNPTETVQAFTKAREASTLLKRMEDAASKAVPDGEFGPTQLLQAARRRGYGTTTGNVASGEARLMDIANAAADVMRNKTANSGTIPRLIATGAPISGTAGAAMVDPTLGAITGAAMLGYVPGLDRAFQNLAINRPKGLLALGDAVERATPYLGGLGAVTAFNFSGN